MLCSIIIALYNKQQFVGTAIASVLAQHYQQFEIIVVDDGSTDAGAAVVAGMLDPRIRLIRQANGGVSRARNRGIDEASGELICFLDADDWYAPQYLAAIVAMAARYPGPTFFASAYQRVGEGERFAPDAAPGADAEAEPIENFYERRQRLGAFFFTGSVAVWRADLMAMQPCFPVGDSFGEDQDLWFRLAERLQLIFLPRKLVAYRIDVAGSLMASHNLQVLPGVFARLETRARQWPAQNCARRFALRIVSDARVSVARHALIEGRRGAALAQLCRAAPNALSMRWWVTAVMCIVGNGFLLKRWELWRERRTR